MRSLLAPILCFTGMAAQRPEDRIQATDMRAQADYHIENDTWERINYLKMQSIVRLIFLATTRAANKPRLPLCAEPDERLPYDGSL